jgi:hypothetical protein
MVTVRRWYVFVVCAVSLNAVTWASIALLRNLFIRVGEAPLSAIAFQIAVILIGLPLFLAHWLWAQRLAGQDLGERESAVRRLYLYGTLAGFLGPFIANAFDFLANLLGLAFGRTSNEFFPQTDGLLYHLVAMVLLTVLWFYYQRIVTAEASIAPERGNAATVRRLYIFGFSATGAALVTLAIIHLLREIMFLVADRSGITKLNMVTITDEVARLMVGMPLWLAFWGWARRLFEQANEEEQESALRKFYLYVVVFIAVFGTVSNATLILAGIFRRLLSLPSTGDLRIPLPIVIGLAVLWAYHAFVLREDAARAVEIPRQAGIRRLYLYLMAAVGLAAFLVGLSGDISVLMRAFSQAVFGEALKEQLAWFTAALLAGLPVWLLPWRQVQGRAVDPTPVGAEERRSIVRKIYLYFYLLVATMSVLSNAVYILSRLVSLLLGVRSEGSLLGVLGQALAFLLIGIGVWFYHGSALRADGQLNRREQANRLAEMRAVLVDVGEGRFGREVLDGLRRELPELSLDLITLPFPANDGTAALETIQAQLAGAEFIVGPWTIAVAGGAGGQVTPEVANAVIASPARKLLVPIQTEGWEWAGVDRWGTDALVHQTVRAVKQLAEGEAVSAIRPMSAGAIIGIVVGVLVLLILLAIPVLLYFSGGF